MTRAPLRLGPQPWGLRAFRSVTTPNRFIVIAWTETTNVWDGQPYAKDLGASAGMVEVKVGCACTWLMSGTKADVKKAKVCANSDQTSDGAKVYTFKVDHKDPLGAAKAKALRAAGVDVPDHVDPIAWQQRCVGFRRAATG